MADFIGGYPAEITVDGNDIIFAKDDFDSIVFGKYEVGDYVANVSLDTPVSQIITAVPGLQDDGTYKITVDDASGWTTGDRCTPQAQEAINWYTAGNTAIANMSMDDRLLLWFYNTNNSKNHFWTSGAQAKAFSISGMAKCLKIIGSRVDNTIYMIGDFSSQTEVAIIENVNFGVAATCIYAKDTSGSGAGFRVTRCSFNDQGLGVFIDTVSAGATPGQVDNCLFIDCYSSIRGRYNEYYFNTIIGAQYGFGYNAQCTIRNCLVEANLFAYEAYMGSDILTNALADDAENNIIHFDKLSEIGLWADESDWNFINPRIVTTSPAYQAGSEITDAIDTDNLYVDFDGNDNSNCSMGFHAGTDNAYPTGDTEPPAPPAITATAGDGQVTVSATSESETDVVYVRFRTATGSWSDENPLFARTGTGDIVVTGLTNGTRYTIAAYSKNAAGTSDWSTPVNATPDDSTQAQTVRLADAVATSLADVGWQVAVDIERDYFEFFNEHNLPTTPKIVVAPGPISINEDEAGYESDDQDYTVVIGIIRKVSSSAEIDECCRIEEDIYRHLRNLKLADLHCATREFTLPYDLDALKTKEFRGVMRFAFRGAA